MSVAKLPPIHQPSKLSKEIVYGPEESSPLSPSSPSLGSSSSSSSVTLSDSGRMSQFLSASPPVSHPNPVRPPLMARDTSTGITSRLSNAMESSIGKAAAADFLQPPVRPGMLRYQSMPAISTLSPTRQHFRLPNSEPRQVKETLDASRYQEDDSGKTRINQYELLEDIGRGSLSSVQVGIDKDTGTKYAIKKFSKSQLRKMRRNEFIHKRKMMKGGRSRNASELQNEWSQNSSPIELIRREVAIMKKLDHPNIVNLIEVLDDPYGDELYMILDWCSKGVIGTTDLQPGSPAGGKLHTRSVYTDEQCRLFFRDMILGIEYLHSQGIVHRDIKAENVLVSDDDVVKIVDFGVSEMFDKNQDNDIYLTNHAGSPAYMAPELVQLMIKRPSPRSHTRSKSDEFEVDSRQHISGKATDIWSMGVVLYFIRFGFMPFNADSISELCDQILHQELRFPDDASPELQSLLSRILEKDPSKRLTMKQVREDPWVTKQGEDDLLSEEENCAVDITPVTEDDLQKAIELIEGVINPNEAAERLRKLHGWRGSLSPSTRSSRAVSPAGRVSSEHELSPPLAALDPTGGHVEGASFLKLARALDEIITNHNSSPSPPARSVSPVSMIPHVALNGSP